MAYCVNCGKEISAQAVMCPQCGHPGPNSPMSVGAVDGRPLASWGKRVGAFLIDLLVFMAFGAAVVFTLVYPRVQDGHITFTEDGEMLGATPQDVQAFATAFILLFSFSALYKLLLEGRDGQTLGKKAVGIRVVRAEDGGPISYGKAFFRWFIAWVLNFIPFGGIVDLLWPLWDPRKQTLHDKAAGTVVVKS